MFNAFGDNRAVGPAGPPGENAFDLIRWTPHAARRLFRESEMINIYFDTATDGIVFKDEKPVGLKNRTGGPTIDLVRKFPDMHQIKHGKYMMHLNDSLFKVSDIPTGVTSPSLIIFALSFKGVSFNIQPRFLFSNENGTRAISIQDRRDEGENYEGFLKIYSSGTSIELPFERTEWATLLIEYRCIDRVVYCRYFFNEEAGVLEPGKEDEEDHFTLYIGGHPDEKGADSAIGSFEVYYANDGSEFLSDKMCQCLLGDISDRVDP